MRSFHGNMASRTGNLNLVFPSVLLMCLIHVVSSQYGCSGSGTCLPSPKDIAGSSIVTANSTCGDPIERYCLAGDCSKICNANDKDLIHPVNYTNDDFSLNSFWKSKNYEFPVYLQIDAGATFMLYRSVVTFFHELPAAMYFAKSNDFGATFTEIAFFSTDCRGFFNMPVTAENKRNGLQVECFKIDHGTNNLKQISYAPMQDEDTATTIKDNVEKRFYFLMTNIRLMLVKFIIDANFNPSPELQKSYYFSIKDWDVAAACFCNGQASACDAQDFSKCVCEKNTAGSNCSKCVDLYNNKPYEVGKACEACGCNDHASGCHYNASVNYGMCDNCTHNTIGDKCELCKPYYYRNSEVAINHTDTCLDCACNASGVVAKPKKLLCNDTTGQCHCKTQVTGRTCSQCHDGYWRLREANSADGCEDCMCTRAGTVNGSSLCDQFIGQCVCKPTLTGRTCDRCKDGYFGLTSNNPRGCKECNCDLAGSVNISCSSSGKCYCRPRFYGQMCEKIDQGYFVPSVQYLLYEAEETDLTPDQKKNINYTMVTDEEGQDLIFVGVKLHEGEIASSPTNLTFLVNVPATGPYTFVLRYMTNYDWSLIKLTALLRTIFRNYSCGSTVYSRNEPRILMTNITAGSESVSFGSSCLLKGEYTIRLEIPQGSSGHGTQAEIIVDSLVLIPTIFDFDEYKMATSAERQNMTRYYNAAFGLRTWSVYEPSGSIVLASFYGRLYGEGQACSCDSVGSNNPSQCSKYGGQCACKPNIMGRTCDKCMPDNFNFTSGQGCQACACNLTGSGSTACNVNTGQCSCYDGVTGRQCDACRLHFYGFNRAPRGCLPCNCTHDYSVDLQCSEAGVCSCKHGVGGDKCVECQDQYYNLTSQGCTSCDCELAGSSNGVCNKTNGQCPCKAHAVQRQCDVCPSGHYGLNSNNPAGCLKCQCSDKSSRCVSDSGWFTSEVETDLSPTRSNVDTDGWTAVDGNGNNIPVFWDFLLLKGIIKVDTASHGEVYFVASEKFLGDKRFAYTHSLSFKLQQDNSSFPAASIKGGVILKGRWFSEPLVAQLPHPPHPGNVLTSYKVKFVQSSWYVGNTSGRHPTSTELVRVLTDLESLHIRAKWTTRNATKTYTRLADIEMMLSNRTSALPQAQAKPATNVENCTCPSPEYTGQFCERCATGFTRATPFGGPYDTCVPCHCNNHSSICHPESGVCIDCQHNTTGNHCENCSDGLAGNAKNGTSQDCIVCKDGFFGQPMKPNGKCQKCLCSNNIDLQDTGNCNTTTGECLKCLSNTTGFRCEWCAPGLYGNALNQTCTKCNCFRQGSVNDTCNNVTGQCTCLSHVTGRLCDRCESNAFNFTSSGCMPCNCDSHGSTDLQCHELYGNCTCNPKVGGAKCDLCEIGTFDVKLNCSDCNCTQEHTQPNTFCDRRSGQCACNMSLGGGDFGGRQCETCGRHTVGDPPYCYPCDEQCYKNWHELIEIETGRVISLKTTVTDLLMSFGKMSVDSINSTLRELNINVTMAYNVFSRGGWEDLMEKKKQIERIESTITYLQQRLNSSQDTLDDAKQYLIQEVKHFNGSIELVPTPADRPLPEVCVQSGGAAVLVDWNCIDAMAHAYRLNALAANASGQRNFSSILNSFHLITVANRTATNAARQIREAVDKLGIVANRSSVVESRLGEHFRAQLKNNSLTLERIRKITNELLALVRQSQMLRNHAGQNVSQAETEIQSAAETVRRRKSEAYAALQSALDVEKDVSEAHEAALGAQNATTLFKENATAVLAQAQASLRNVTAGINTVARVSNMTKEAAQIAEEVDAMGMPVSVQEIQSLVDQINGTPVNETLINSTFEGAAEGLKRAREVEALSQRASEKTEETLNQVNDIETAMQEADELREETRSLQQQTDNMVSEIVNITQSVTNRFSKATNVGEETLKLINSTVNTLDSSLKCFDTAKKTVTDALKNASLAYNVSAEAKEVFDESKASLAQAEAEVNATYNVAKANYTDIEQAHRDAQKLQKDVGEAEVLLQEYIQQRDELLALQQQVQDLEGKADDLVSKFAQASQEYDKCDGSIPV